jgi:hypothetical protein
MKFTAVELAAQVEKDAASPVNKATVGPRALEGHAGREARWRGRKTGCCALARWRVGSLRRRGRAAEHGLRGGTGVRRRYMR